MMAVHALVLKLRRGDTQFFSRLKYAVRRVRRANLPLPRSLSLAMRALHRTWSSTVEGCRWLAALIYREPIFRSMCASAGARLYLEQVPVFSGSVDVTVGDDVTVSGNLVIAGAHTFDRPRVSIGDRAFLGHRLTIMVAQEVIIEEGAGIAPGCFIADYDGHPSDLALRIAGAPTPKHEVKPVRIGKNAWIGRDSYVLKGVTIGEGAVVGVASVVTSDVPSFAVAFGNPARVVRSVAGTTK
jgi:acetyltransferase-like isoleucine patch superfamily enzyme